MVMPPAGRDPGFAGVVVIFVESFNRQFIHFMAMLRGSIAAGL
jgi:hypothetical protein